MLLPWSCSLACWPTADGCVRPLQVKVHVAQPAAARSTGSSSSGSGSTTSVSQGPPAPLQQLPQLLPGARSSSGGGSVGSDTQQPKPPPGHAHQQQQGVAWAPQVGQRLDVLVHLACGWANAQRKGIKLSGVHVHVHT
jgi:hypothetical protein